MLLCNQYIFTFLCLLVYRISKQCSRSNNCAINIPLILDKVICLVDTFLRESECIVHFLCRSRDAIPLVGLDSVSTAKNALCHSLEHYSILVVLGIAIATTLIVSLNFSQEGVVVFCQLSVSIFAGVRTFNNRCGEVCISIHSRTQLYGVNHFVHEGLISSKQSIVHLLSDIGIGSCYVLIVEIIKICSNFAEHYILRACSWLGESNLNLSCMPEVVACTYDADKAIRSLYEERNCVLYESASCEVGEDNNLVPCLCITIGIV